MPAADSSRRVRSGPRRTAAALLSVSVAAAVGAGLVASGAASASAAPTSAVRDAAAAAPTAVPRAAATPTTSGTSPAPTVSGTVFRADFEDGTTDGFTGDPATVRVAPAAGGSAGSGSLAVTGLTGYGQGARVTLPSGLPAGYYSAYASVRLPLSEGPLARLQDMRVTLPGSPSVDVIESGTLRATDTGWAGVVTYFHISATTSLVAPPVSVRVEPVAACQDAPAVPLPYSVDQVFVNYIGTTPPPLPLLPSPSCPLNGSSSGSPSVSVTTPPPATCRVTYRVDQPWPGGFQASVRLETLLPTKTVGWHLTWTFPAGQRLQSLWGGVGVQSGQVVTVTNPAWNPVLAPGTPVTIGLVATRTDSGATVPAPTDLALDGARCDQA